ncbi:MAG: MarR family transcriptional regulator [Gemmataceae bacterium]
MDAAPIPRPRRTFDSLDQEVYLNLWRTYDLLKATEDALFARYDLTAQQYNALRLLKAAYPGSLRTLELASRLISRAPDITRLVDKLETRGLVRRDYPPDNRRVVQLTLTEAGLDLLRELAEPVRQCNAAQVGHLSDEQKKQLIELLQAARAPHLGEHPW